MDDQGRFDFGSLPPALYFLDTSIPAWGTWSMRVELRAYSTADVSPERPPRRLTETAHPLVSNRDLLGEASSLDGPGRAPLLPCGLHSARKVDRGVRTVLDERAHARAAGRDPIRSVLEFIV